MTPADRLILEAAAAARDYRFDAARRLGAREASAITLGELAIGGEAQGHILAALRSATIALAMVDTSARAHLASAMAELVKAARARPSASPSSSTSTRAGDDRPYWLRGDAA